MELIFYPEMSEVTSLSAVAKFYGPVHNLSTCKKKKGLHVQVLRLLVAQSGEIQYITKNFNYGL